MNLIDEKTRSELRTPDAVLCGSDMNGAWGTRHSFARTMLRRAASHHWRVTKTRLDLDDLGRGTAVFTVNTEGHELKFIAFCQALEESERTDRVIANAWDVTAALVEGELTPEREAELRRNITVQEQGRTDPETIIMTRANRSARFFDYVSDCLADGHQPDVATIGPSPYLIRSTAFYGNGKFGLKELSTFPAGHPLAVPYRSQMLAAWLLRELSMDLVEHVARAKAQAAGTVAVALDVAWGRYFGLGNATGLGMVPFLVNHPGYLDAWCKLRELPLAAGLTAVYAPEHPDLVRIEELLERADRHLAEKSALKTVPFLSTEAIRPQLGQLLRELQEFRNSDRKATPVLATLHEMAAGMSPEARGLFASIVIELRSDFDAEADALLTVAAPKAFNPAMRCDELGALLEQNYGWTRSYDFASAACSSYYWYTSADSEEPRREQRSKKVAGTVEHCTDVARRINALAGDLTGFRAETSVAEFLLAHPDHRFAVERVQQTKEYHYRDLQDNLLDVQFLPLSTQRFQLATYGMNNFSPQSTDWVRVTLFSGAPRVAEVMNGQYDDDWLFPLAPEGESK